MFNKNEQVVKKKKYPNCITFNEIDLRQANFNYSKLNRKHPVDSKIIFKLSQNIKATI